MKAGNISSSTPKVSKISKLKVISNVFHFFSLCMYFVCAYTCKHTHAYFDQMHRCWYGCVGKGGGETPNLKKITKIKIQSNPKTTKPPKETKKGNLKKSAVSLQWNQSDAYMILLNTDDITGLKIGKISTETTS